MTDTVTPTRVIATTAARQAIARLRGARGGDVLMFIQSGGCRAGNTPMCYPAGEFVLGDSDLLLGVIDDCPFYIDRRLDAAWHQDEFVLDVDAGEAEGFSLPAGDDLRFINGSPSADRCDTSDEI